MEYPKRLLDKIGTIKDEKILNKIDKTIKEHFNL